MRLEALKNVITVVECGTITEAARKICIAQPALSNQIRGLEEELGVQLFHRTPRSMELTEAGRILYRHSRSICGIRQALYRELQGRSQGGGETLRLGLSSSLPSSFAARILQRTSQNLPLAQFDLYTGSALDVTEMVKDGLTELGIMDAPSTLPPGLATLLSFPIHFYVVYSMDNLWLSTARESVTVADLHNIPLGLSREDADLVALLCRQQGFLPWIKCVSSSRSYLRFWAEQGLAVTLVSRSPGDAIPKNMCCKPLTGASAQLNRCFFSRQEEKLSSIGRMFLTCASQLYAPPAAERSGRI